jgi:hypothetical protein
MMLVELKVLKVGSVMTQNGVDKEPDEWANMKSR